MTERKREGEREKAYDGARTETTGEKIPPKPKCYMEYMLEIELN